MATFYGQVDGCTKTMAGRRGSYESGIHSSVQSWDGSVDMRMRYKDENIKDSLEICVAISKGSSFYGDTVFWGSLEELHEALETYMQGKKKVCYDPEKEIKKDYEY